jgi:hypothetical protein
MTNSDIADLIIFLAGTAFGAFIATMIFIL